MEMIKKILYITRLVGEIWLIILFAKGLQIAISILLDIRTSMTAANMMRIVK
jgi:hypothetical protein